MYLPSTEPSSTLAQLLERPSIGPGSVQLYWHGFKSHQWHNKVRKTNHSRTLQEQRLIMWLKTSDLLANFSDRAPMKQTKTILNGSSCSCSFIHRLPVDLYSNSWQLFIVSETPSRAATITD